MIYTSISRPDSDSAPKPFYSSRRNETRGFYTILLCTVLDVRGTNEAEVARGGGGWAGASKCPLLSELTISRVQTESCPRTTSSITPPAHQSLSNRPSGASDYCLPSATCSDPLRANSAISKLRALLHAETVIPVRGAGLDGASPSF